MIWIGLAALSVAAWISTSPAGEISTDEIVNKTVDVTFACLTWQPVGLLFRLRCS